MLSRVAADPQRVLEALEFQPTDVAPPVPSLAMQAGRTTGTPPLRLPRGPDAFAKHDRWQRDVAVGMLHSAAEAAACTLRDIPPDDDLHIFAGSCPLRDNRLPRHLHVVDWLTCHEALAGSNDIDRSLDERAHLLTPVWKGWALNA